MNEEFEKMRAEFEAWLLPSWSRETYTDEDGDLQYQEDWVQGAWIAWQASRKQAVEEAAEICADVTQEQVANSVAEASCYECVCRIRALNKD